MPASRGKALPFLRSVNAFLRFLPRTPEDLVFRGRIHQFASSVISIADKSAINLRGDYNEINTIWEEAPVPSPKDEVTTSTDYLKEDSKGDADGDVVMSAETSKEEVKVDAKPGKEDKEAVKPEADFYSTLWSLQQYFAHPPSLAPSSSTSASTPRTPEPTTTPFASFRQKSEIVLPILFEQTKKQKDLMGREVESGTKKRKRDEAGVGSEGAGDFFYPRYLTGKKLLEHEVGPFPSIQFESGAKKLTDIVSRSILPSPDPRSILYPLPVPPPPYTGHGIQTSLYRWYAQELRYRGQRRIMGQGTSIPYP
jgi:THO complex subunit 1